MLEGCEFQLFHLACKCNCVFFYHPVTRVEATCNRPFIVVALARTFGSQQMSKKCGNHRVQILSVKQACKKNKTETS